ncbi:hypothetical protein ACFXKR_31595 [Streptomyces violascens]|uniref:hypothetical protein n=1 Tax=Streptomyces violascens TaxID=67381 RepID=UPI0036CA25E3
MGFHYLGGRTTTYYRVEPLTSEGAEQLVRHLTSRPYETGTPSAPSPICRPGLRSSPGRARVSRRHFGVW